MSIVREGDVMTSEAPAAELEEAASQDRSSLPAEMQPVAASVERRVQIAFAAAALAVIFLLDRAIKTLWELVAEPKDIVASAVAVVIAASAAIFAYRNPSVHRLAFDVAGELSKVSWPTRKEAWAATIVVIITSLVAAAILFGFDALWSSITDLIYKA